MSGTDTVSVDRACLQMERNLDMRERRVPGRCRMVEMVEPTTPRGRVMPLASFVLAAPTTADRARHTRHQ